MNTYIASSQKPWILDSGASSHITGIKQNFDLLNLSDKFPFINIADGIWSPVLGNRVVQVTPSLTLTDVLYVLKFLVSLLSISQFTKQNNCRITFFPSHCIYQDLSTGRRIGSRYERWGMYYLDDTMYPTVFIAGQPDPILLWHCPCKSFGL